MKTLNLPDTAKVGTPVENRQSIGAAIAEDEAVGAAVAAVAAGVGLGGAGAGFGADEGEGTGEGAGLDGEGVAGAGEVAAAFDLVTLVEAAGEDVVPVFLAFLVDPVEPRFLLVAGFFAPAFFGFP